MRSPWTCPKKISPISGLLPSTSWSPLQTPSITFRQLRWVKIIQPWRLDLKSNCLMKKCKALVQLQYVASPTNFAYLHPLAKFTSSQMHLPFILLIKRSKLPKLTSIIFVTRFRSLKFVKETMIQEPSLDCHLIQMVESMLSRFAIESQEEQNIKK